PFPIAWSYRQLRTDLRGHREDRDALRQLVLLKDCVETLVKYLALVVLAARLQRRPPADALDRAALEMLVAPSLGTWAPGIPPAPARRASLPPARPGEFVLAADDGEPLALHPFLALLGCPGCERRDRLFLYDSQKQYTPAARRVVMLENVGGHKGVFEEPARG